MTELTREKEKAMSEPTLIEKPKARKVCRYCLAGSEVNDNGEHWIVKSIWPAKITIIECPDFRADLSSEEAGK